MSVMTMLLALTQMAAITAPALRDTLAMGLIAHVSDIVVVFINYDCIFDAFLIFFL